MDALHELEAGFAYVREALAARMAEPRHDPARDASLALTILGLLAASDARRNACETKSATVCRESSRRSNEVCEEPYVINFERAKARILARRASNERASAPCAHSEPRRPRLRIYRGE